MGASSSTATSPAQPPPAYPPPLIPPSETPDITATSPPPPPPKTPDSTATSPPPPSTPPAETLDSTTTSPPPTSTPYPDPQSKTPESNQPDPSSAAAPSAETPPDAVKINGTGEGAEGEDDDEQAECGFCVFMKGGGCKDAFIAWEDCVNAAGKAGEDAAEKCAEVTGLLMKCMLTHTDYYAPIIRAEKAMSEAIEAEASEPALETIESAPEVPKSKD